jgi:outer membrane protein assembly factor BamB
LFGSRVPVADRIVGLLLFVALQAWIVFAQVFFEGFHPRALLEGAYLHMVSIPVMFTGIVGLLAVTIWVPWKKRRLVLVIMMILCTGVFTALRVDGVYGSLAPVLAWRWDPVAGELPAELIEVPDRPAEKAVLPAEAGPQDWPGFRGPARDNRVAGVTFATNWTNNPPREVWRRPVGAAWSSFAVVGDYVFTQEQRGDDECVVCYKAASGEEVWVNRVAVRFDNEMGGGPRATPTFDRGKLYTFGATGILQCLDASTGTTVWQVDVLADTDAEVPQWGYAGSPLVAEDLVIVFAGAGEGKGVAAYDRVSGNLTWCSGDGSHAYCSGHFAQVAGVPQVLMNSDVGVQSFVPESGEVLWEHRWHTKSNPRCIQPLFPDANSVLIGTAGGQGTRLLTVDQQEGSWRVEEQWTSKRLRPYFNDFVYHEGHCYGYDGKRFICMDARTGERRWRGSNYGGQVLLVSDMAMLLLLTEKGDVVLVDATAEGFHEVAGMKALENKTWNHPVVANGKLFVRNDREAACFDLPT